MSINTCHNKHLLQVLASPPRSLDQNRQNKAATEAKKSNTEICLSVQYHILIPQAWKTPRSCFGLFSFFKCVLCVCLRVCILRPYSISLFWQVSLGEENRGFSLMKASSDFVRRDEAKSCLGVLTLTSAIAPLHEISVCFFKKDDCRNEPKRTLCSFSCAQTLPQPLTKRPNMQCCCVLVSKWKLKYQQLYKNNATAPCT